MRGFIDPFLHLFKQHYNNTENRQFYNMETNQVEIFAYKESMKDIMAADVITIAFLYYILSHL